MVKGKDNTEVSTKKISNKSPRLSSLPIKLETNDLHNFAKTKGLEDRNTIFYQVSGWVYKHPPAPISIF